MSRRLCVLFLAAVFSAPSSASAIAIYGNFIGGTQLGPSVGSGNIVDVFEAAAATWEGAFLDDFDLFIDYGWGVDPGGYHFLQAQGGVINRETQGLILVQPQIYAPGEFATLFLDPTPTLNEEFSSEISFTQDLGAGELNVGRLMTASSNAPTGEWQDLYTILLHEIGHALGLSNANATYIADGADGSIEVRDPLPFAGTVIPLARNNYGVTSHLDLPNGRPVMSGLGFRDRQLPSAVDVLVNAQLSGFTNVNLEPTQPAHSVPEPSTLLLLGMGLAANCAIKRRQQHADLRARVSRHDPRTMRRVRSSLDARYGTGRSANTGQRERRCDRGALAAAPVTTPGTAYSR